MKVWAALLLAAGLSTSATAQEANESPSISEIRVHLYYTLSGVLSENVLDPRREREFAGWNVIIGEGDAREPADDLLVDVVVQTGGHDFIDVPLVIWVTNGEGETIGSRTVRTMLTSDDGVVHNPLWLENVGCAGTLTFNARFRGQHRTAELELACGE